MAYGEDDAIHPAAHVGREGMRSQARRRKQPYDPWMEFARQEVQASGSALPYTALKRYVEAKVPGAKEALRRKEANDAVVRIRTSLAERGIPQRKRQRRKRGPAQPSPDDESRNQHVLRLREAMRKKDHVAARKALAELRTNHPSYTPTRRVLVYERDEWECLRCGSTEELTLDHIVPRSKGGNGSLDNLQTLCAPCNNRKASQTSDFRPPIEATELG